MKNIRRLKADEIECRIAQVNDKGCSLLLYKTARVDRAILDEIYSDLWQNDFKVIDGKMYGGIGVYNEELKDWIWRWDCGTESNTEAEKGQASDCFKRAGFKWGIGVELYTAPFIWINIETEKVTEGSSKKNRYQLKDRFIKFSVKSIEYGENGNITNLVIISDKGEQVYPSKQKPKNVQKESPKTDPVVKLVTYNEKKELKEKIGAIEFAKEMNANGGKLTVDRYNELMGVS